MHKGIVRVISRPQWVGLVHWRKSLWDVWRPYLRLGRDKKSLVLSPDLLTRDQEQVLKLCLTPSKIYNHGTPSMGSILTMNTWHERNGKLFICQVLAANSALNGKNTCIIEINNHTLLVFPILNKFASSVLHIFIWNKSKICQVSAAYIRTSMIYLITRHEK
jgi:hypothetical protein